MDHRKGVINDVILAVERGTTIRKRDRTIEAYVIPADDWRRLRASLRSMVGT